MAAESAKTEIKVGLFVLAALLVLGYLSLRLGGESLAPRKGYELYLLVDTASGLASNSMVEMAGVEVGRVKRIEVSGSEAKVTMLIYPEFHVAADSEIWIRTKGVLGDKFLEIRQGDVNKGVLESGSRIAHVVRPIDLDELFVDMGPVMEDLKSVAKGLGEVIGSEEGREKTSEILTNLRDATSSISTVAGNLEKGKGALGKLLTDESLYVEAKESVSVLNEVATKINRGEGTLGKLVNDETLYQEARETVGSLKAVSLKLDRGDGTLGKLINDDSLYRSAKETMTTLQNAAEDIKKGEGTLGKLMQDDSLYNEAKKTLDSVNKAAEGVQEQVPITVFGTLVGTAVR
jgi:phospholipid/cholesterol/gamma-HCH transport system substrate-binding protein